MGCGSGEGGQAASFVSCCTSDLFRLVRAASLLLFAYLDCNLFGSGTVPYDVLVCHRACDIPVLFQGSECHWQARGTQDDSRASWQVGVSSEPCHLMGGSLPCNDSTCCSEGNLQSGFSSFPDTATPKAKEKKRSHFFQTSLNKLKFGICRAKKKKAQVSKKPSATHVTASNTGVVITTWVRH